MSEENHFSSAIQYWKGIQLSNLQKELDQQGLAIVEKQKDGLVSRKRLAEQTRGIQYKKKIPFFFFGNCFNIHHSQSSKRFLTKKNFKSLKHY